ncbi:MAG: hypothetical protein V4568_04705 [Pseudomonadota bacterium]
MYNCIVSNTFLRTLGFIILTLTSLTSWQEAFAWNLMVCQKGCNYATIQDAVNNAQQGDTIHVMPGFYLEDIIITGKSLTLKSEDNDRTIINGTGKRPVITLSCSDNRTNIRIASLNITGGNAVITDDVFVPTGGGGVSNDRCGLVIDDSNIYGNHALGTGGGVSTGTGSATIKNTSITNNSASAGAGVDSEGQLLIVNSTINSNHITSQVSAAGGGGVLNRGNLTVRSSNINNNIAGGNCCLGGGIANRSNSKLTLSGSTVANNQGVGIINRGTAEIQHGGFNVQVQRGPF